MSDNSQQFDTAYDLVVIGGGSSGKAAALTAAQAGLHVAILEKLSQAIGTGQHAEGIAAYESSEQKCREGVNGHHYPTREEGFRMYIESSHYRANPDVVRMFVDNSAETIDIFKDLGAEFSDVVKYVLDEPDELRTFHTPEGMGARCQEVLLKAVQQAGVDIFTSTAAEHLIMQDGAAAGVVARDADGNEVRVGAKAVIIATGGYGNNPDFREKYSFFAGDAREICEAAESGNTGDGFILALEAGGVLLNTGVLLLGGGGRGKLITSQSGAAGFHPWLWVNRTGRRFVSEEVGMIFAKTGMTLAQQPGSEGFGIVDADALRHLTEDGSDISIGVFVPYHVPMQHLMEELESDLATGTAWRGDTIEALAVAMGLEPEVLAQTVATYNAACDTGYDPEFFKPAQYLRPMRKPPFYAISIGPNVCVSVGGIRVNGNLQVTDGDYRPIPGLYAVGNEASGLYGDCYSLNAPGTTNGFAHTSGRMAARHVIAALQAKE